MLQAASDRGKYFVRERKAHPDWCGSVDGVLACKPKGYRFDPQSGYMPGLLTRSPVRGVRGVTTH